MQRSRSALFTVLIILAMCIIAPATLTGAQEGATDSGLLDMLALVPDNALARAFRDAQGLLNQRLASVAARVVLMVAGLPLTVKGPS